MHHSTSISPGRWLALAGKVGALTVALVLMSSTWAVAAVCHGCEGGGGGGGGGTATCEATFASEPRITGTPKVGAISGFSDAGSNPTPAGLDSNLTSWHVGSGSTWSNTNAQVSTSSTYTPVAADQNKYLFAKFTVSGDSPECSEVWTTTGKLVGVGDKVAPTVVPTISGGTSVGSLVTLNLGTWTPTPTMYFMKWRRNNTVIPGAESATYTVTSADLGTTISAQVITLTPGHINGQIDTAGLAIPGNIPSTIAAGTPSSSFYGAAKTGTVTVSAATGVPSGRVRVLVGSTQYGQWELINGKATVNLATLLAVGTHTVTYEYVPSGSPHIASSTTVDHTVKKARTTTTYKWRKAPTRKKTGILRVYVTSPDASKVTDGMVRVKVGPRIYLKTVTNGYVDIRIGKFKKKGKRSFYRAYLGAESFAKSSSTKFTLRVK